MPWQRVREGLSDPWSSPPGHRMLESPGLQNYQIQVPHLKGVEREAQRERGQNLHKAVKEPELKPRSPDLHQDCVFVVTWWGPLTLSQPSQTLKAGRGDPDSCRGWHQSVISPSVPSWSYGMMYMVLAQSELDRVEKQSQEAPWCPSIIYPEPTSQHDSPKIDKNQWRRIGSGISGSPLET